MGGGIAARVAVLSPDVRAYVLFAPISARVEDNFYELPAQELQWLRERYGVEGSQSYALISPLTYFERIAAPLQLHHGTADTAVPPRFSEEMFTTLRSEGKKAEYYEYPGAAHEFIEEWSLAAARSLQFFDYHLEK
jgi:dipeptidyl aminopeptidase/acylaminoacyl peptidase